VIIAAGNNNNNKTPGEKKPNFLFSANSSGSPPPTTRIVIFRNYTYKYKHTHTHAHSLSLSFSLFLSVRLGVSYARAHTHTNKHWPRRNLFNGVGVGVIGKSFWAVTAAWQEKRVVSSSLKARSSTPCWPPQIARSRQTVLLHLGILYSTTPSPSFPLEKNLLHT